MQPYTVFPDAAITKVGEISERFVELGICRFHDACQWAHALPYGYNSDRDDLMILFEEKMGTCTTKHAVIATLAAELSLPVEKNIGIYAMTEEIVSGTDEILQEYRLPYVPMIHCFLVHGDCRVDLTEGNANGKKQAIDTFLHTERVVPNISAKNEYLKYRKALKENIINRSEMRDVGMVTVLHAREKGLGLLKANLG